MRYRSLVTPTLAFRPGESNCWRAAPGHPHVDESPYYACALPRLISALRDAFRSPSAHVAVVQLAPWLGYGTPSAAAGAIRQAQLTACDGLKGVSVVSAVDAGDAGGNNWRPGSVHPREKQLVGRRTAAAALRVRYRRPAAPFSGPRYTSARSGGGLSPATLSATVFFSSASEDSDSSPLTLRPGPALRCPEVKDAPKSDCAGCFVRDQYGRWYAAEASLTQDGHALVLAVTSGSVTSAAEGVPLQASATACGWGTWPLVPVASRQGIPAFPWNETVAVV